MVYNYISNVFVYKITLNLLDKFRMKSESVLTNGRSVLFHYKQISGDIDLCQ